MKNGLKSWDYAKRQVHDISGITNPEDYLYQLSCGVYYPAIRKVDVRAKRLRPH